MVVSITIDLLVVMQSLGPLQVLEMLVRPLGRSTYLTRCPCPPAPMLLSLMAGASTPSQAVQRQVNGVGIYAASTAAAVALTLSFGTAVARSN